MRVPSLAIALTFLAAACSAEPPPRKRITQRGTVGPAPPVFPVRPTYGRTGPLPKEPPYRRIDREAMVDRYLGAIGVTDERVLKAMRTVQRHLFVPKEYEESAYDDTPLPIGHGQTISAPDIVGYMSQAIGVEPGAKVLDVGTGSGYQAAVLGEMGCRVLSIEIVEELAADAAARLDALGYKDVTVKAGDGYRGWPEEAPFDAILVAAAPDHVPQPLIDQLRTGGKLVLPVGPVAATQKMLILTKKADGTADREETLAVRFVPMTGEAQDNR
ncbi:MAG: protein-L-isoaspartate(D-aspartate) O-methyltransferase [Planctomycetota bacterium]|jgi:protein-L-isoaspartate(D-aspartate) O-methyltransferase